jgi:hypothetical protein
MAWQRSAGIVSCRFFDCSIHLPARALFLMQAQADAASHQLRVNQPINNDFKDLRMVVHNIHKSRLAPGGQPAVKQII